MDSISILLQSSLFFVDLPNVRLYNASVLKLFLQLMVQKSRTDASFSVGITVFRFKTTHGLVFYGAPHPSDCLS